MNDPTDYAVLDGLNRNYVRAVREADVGWFEKHLSEDFHNTNPDGSLLDRAAFLAQIGRGSPAADLREHDVKIRLLGNFAIIHAQTSFRKPDGSTGSGRYTDDWQKGRDGWRCVSAHVSRF